MCLWDVKVGKVGDNMGLRLIKNNLVGIDIFGNYEYRGVI